MEQEELCVSIPELVECMYSGDDHDGPINWIDGFFKTMVREWDRIDFFRMNKFKRVRCDTLRRDIAGKLTCVFCH